MPATNVKLVQDGQPYSVKPYAVLAFLLCSTVTVMFEGGEAGLKTMAWNGLVIFGSDYLIYVVLKRVKQYVDQRRERRRLS